MKSTECLKDFIAKGMTAVEIKFAEPRATLQSVITIPTAVYEKLLKNAFNHIPLFTGKINGQDRPIRYDAITRLFFSKEDGRLLIPVKLIEEQLKRSTEDYPMSNLGAEIARQAKAGKVDAPLFKYDVDGKYIGVEINGEVMAPAEVRKPYDNKICRLCSNPSVAKCGHAKASITVRPHVKKPIGPHTKINVAPSKKPSTSWGESSLRSQGAKPWALANAGPAFVVDAFSRNAQTDINTQLSVDAFLNTSPPSRSIENRQVIRPSNVRINSILLNQYSDKSCNFAQVKASIHGFCRQSLKMFTPVSKDRTGNRIHCFAADLF